MPNADDTMRRMIIPSYDQPLQQPTIDPIDIFAGLATGGIMALGKSGIRAVAPEIEKSLATRALRVPQSLIEHTIETSGRPVSEAATNFANWRAGGRILPVKPEEATSFFRGFIGDFEEAAKMATTRGKEDIASHLRNFSKLAEAAANDTGARPYYQHVRKILIAADRHAAKLLGYDPSY